jgi:hypothetical protein
MLFFNNFFNLTEFDRKLDRQGNKYPVDIKTNLLEQYEETLEYSVCL